MIHSGVPKQAPQNSCMNSSLELGVNIDHVASLRQARGTAYPDVLEAARICEKAGAKGITVHLREDRRHIQDADVYRLRRAIKTRLNLEMADTAEILRIALDVQPDEVCIVPERRAELTTEGGLDVIRTRKHLGRTIRTCLDSGIGVSLFIDPTPDQIQAARDLGAPCIELHTGNFCNASGAAARREMDRLIKGAQQAHELGMIVNAGHGISISNIQTILRMPFLHTLNIGHSIVSRAVFIGLAAAVTEMLEAMRRGPGRRS